MLENLQMNDHRITGLTNPPSGDGEAVNKNMLMKIFQKAVLNYLTLQKTFFNISWMM